MIGPGVKIGEHSIVTANSVVVNDVPAFSMAAVNPARVARFRS
jgi:acetyltransferase-like isoleucine patch superfamily enzyme